MVIMNTMDSQGNLHRGQGSGGGQFVAKSNSAPSAGLTAPAPTFDDTSYAIHVDGALAANSRVIDSEFIALAHTVAEQHLGAKITFQAQSGVNGLYMHLNDVELAPPGFRTVVEYHGNFFPLEELHTRQLTTFDVEVYQDEVITITDEDQRIDLPEIAEWLTETTGDGPYLVDAAPSVEEGKIDVCVGITDNLMWRGDFTEADLDENYTIVADVYREWFNAEINVDEGWDSFDVMLSVTADSEGATALLLLEASRPAYAKFRNETDPGTFGSPYVGTEIRRRIDAASTAPQTPAGGNDDRA